MLQQTRACEAVHACGDNPSKKKMLRTSGVVRGDGDGDEGVFFLFRGRSEWMARLSSPMTGRGAYSFFSADTFPPRNPKPGSCILHHP